MHVIRVHIYKIFSIVLLTSNVIVTGIDLTTSLNNDMVQDAIVRRIEVIGEAVGRLPDSLKARYPDIPWQDIKDMRNLPEGFLRPYFSRLFSARVGELTFWRVLLANLLIPFLGTQFMNLFRVGRYPGGLYVLPIFWVIYGLLLGTNSFVFADQPIPFSISVLWTRTGFNELLAYTAGYEASREWALWEQQGFWHARRLADKRWRPCVQDWVYWSAGFVLLVVAVAREVQR